MGGSARVHRTASLFEAGRKIVESGVLSRNPELEGMALRVAVARILYKKDPQIQKFLDTYDPALTDRAS